MALLIAKDYAFTIEANEGDEETDIELIVCLNKVDPDHGYDHVVATFTAYELQEILAPHIESQAVDPVE